MEAGATMRTQGARGGCIVESRIASFRYAMDGVPSNGKSPAAESELRWCWMSQLSRRSTAADLAQ